MPQGRNIFPELSVRHNLELGATAAAAGVDVAARIESVMDRFPMLRERAAAQASTLSGGQQKLLEIARSLLLDPKLMLIDEPSIGLSPRLVQETFAHPAGPAREGHVDPDGRAERQARARDLGFRRGASSSGARA